MMADRMKATVPLAFMTMMAACGGSPGSPGPELPPSYVALPDTLVCVVDRTAPSGLRELPAKKDGASVVVFSEGEVTPLEELHPVNMIAGYAGGESWLAAGESLTFGTDRFSNVGGERRVPVELVERVGEHRGILLFAGRDDDPPPDALYVPTAPGCIFQPFVREDLIRR